MTHRHESIRTLMHSVHFDNLEVVERDIENALKNKQSNLTVQTGTFYFNDGTNKRLVKLCGLIFTNYHNSRYNIPIELWIQEKHPNSPPICYVKPTSNMYVSSRDSDVKSDGKIVISYLHNWTPATSSLTKLIDELSKAFSERSPVYSIPSSASTQVPHNRPSTAVDQSEILDNEDDNNNRCRICLDKDIDCVLLECGHLVSCSTCATHFTICPICRAKVVRTKKIFRT